MARDRPAPTLIRCPFLKAFSDISPPQRAVARISGYGKGHTWRPEAIMSKSSLAERRAHRGQRAGPIQIVCPCHGRCLLGCGFAGVGFGRVQSDGLTDLEGVGRKSVSLPVRAWRRQPGFFSLYSGPGPACPQGPNEEPHQI